MFQSSCSSISPSSLGLNVPVKTSVVRAVRFVL